MIFLRARNRQFFSNLPTLVLVCIGAGLAPGVFGCTVGIEEERVTQVPTVSEVQSKSTVKEKVPEPLATIKEATLEEQPFKLQELSVCEEHGQTTIRLQFSDPASQYRHFSLTQPSRIVLDIFGETKRLAQVESFRADTNWVGALRLSSSEGYLRLVMEIAAATVPPYVVEPESGGLKVIIGPLDPKATAKKELQLIQGGKRTDINIKVAEAKPAVPETAPTASVAPETAPSAPLPRAVPATDKPGVLEAAPQVPQAPLAAEKEYTGQRISLDFKDADIKNIFRLLAEVSGRNIVITEDVVKKKVTVRLVDVPWEQALDILLETNDLGKEQVGNVVRISTQERLRRKDEEKKKRRQASEQAESPETAFLNVNYAKATEVVKKIKEAKVLTEGGEAIGDDRTNTVLIRDIKKAIGEATDLVSRLDIRAPQVLIESNLIETTPTFARALGFEFNFDAPIRGSSVDPVTGRLVQLRSSFPAGSPADPTPFFSVFQSRVGAFRNLAARLSAAESEGNIKIISRPSVVTLNNETSKIESLRIVRIKIETASTITQTGDQPVAPSVPAVQDVEVGITLEVTPQVSSDGFILMKIEVKSSSLGPTTIGAAIPDELSRKANSIVLVRDGETVVIGGIMKDTSQQAEAGVPYLKDIPIFGWLFKNIRWQKDFEELMVFITPRIITAGGKDLPAAEELWREQMKKTEGGKPLIGPMIP